ncbi:MAG: ABC transporter ATP-binding protein [Clostridiales bacterium]|jgi:ATP-binding cassette subfamily B multidrug efflux pump|nr:ABC transporter ATP-binding protein [Clostridiales bacterium]
MFKLLRFLKGLALVCAIGAPLLMVIEVLMDLQQPTLMSQIVDIGIRNGDLRYVLTTGLKMLGCALIGLIGGAGCTVLSSVAAIRMSRDMRAALFARIQTFSFRELDRFKTSSLITRLTNDVTQVQNMMMMAMRMLVRAPVTCIGGIVMAISISPRLSLILALAMPILLIAMFFIITRSFPLFRVVQNKIDRMNDVTRENLLGIRVTKAFVCEDRQRERFNASNEDLMNTVMRASRISVILWPIINIVINACIIAVFWFGGRMVIGGELEIGKIMAFISYITQILASLMMSVMFIMFFTRAKVSADRINEVFDTNTSIYDVPNAESVSGTDLEFRNVSFRYSDTAEYTLRDLNFTIPAGESVGIIGATGSGKSSLVSLIPRLYDPSEGEILLGGKDLRQLKLHDIRAHIGMVLQESILFSGKVSDIFHFGQDDLTEVEMEKAASDAQALDFIREKENGFDSAVEQRGRNFSGGQKQRLSIGRTLARNPSILILDDATSAVDLATEAKLQRAIKAREGTCTLIIIAQRISAVMGLDRVFVIDNGQLVDAGTHRELMARCEIYRSIAASQLGEEAAIHV